MDSRNLPMIALTVFAGLALSANVHAAPAPTPSSHREAPGITGMPKVDSTDFYMFNSYETGRRAFVTIIADYQPFQTPYGGPNFFQMDPDALYQIHIDNDGDAREDITFTFRFTNTLRDIAINPGNLVSVPIALYNSNTLGPAANQNAALNILETFTVDVTYGDRYTGHTFRCTNFDTGSQMFMKPADNVGAKTFSDYETYARNHIARVRLPGAATPARVFVGQRKDPFVVNLGETFDLVNNNPLGPETGKPDSLADANVTAICIEAPAAFLRGTDQNQKIIGGWTSASLPKTRNLAFMPDSGLGNTADSTGAYRQVSRLGMPLVNELVIGLRDKDKFGASRPRNDSQFALYVTNPTLPTILGSLFSVTPPTLPRNDLVAVFLTGVAGLNQPTGVVASEMLRLNTDTVAIAPKPRGMQNRIGVIAGDNAGFPNGRRPGDDVVDIALRVVMGALYPDAGVTGGNAPVGNLAFTDGAFIDDSFFDAVFPYLKRPLSASPAVP